MKGLIITDKGLEEISALEVKELIGVKGEIKDSVVLFDYKKKEDLYLLCYKGQAVFRVLELITEFKIKEDLIEEIKENIKRIDFSKYLKKNQTFAVRCGKKKIEQQRSEIEEAVGEVIDGKVDLEEPEIRFFIFVNGKEVYFGLDVSHDLSEREYKIFTHPNALKGPMAYALVRWSEWKPGKTLLNVFCKSGEIGIEAALLGSGLAVNYYAKDKMDFEFDLSKFDTAKKKKLKIICIDEDSRSLAATKKNAKIAGVHEHLGVSRIPIEDLDIKFKEGEVDSLIVHIGRRVELEKMKELFYQAKFILNGKLVICGQEKDNFDQLAESQKFKKIDEKLVERGGINYKVLIYEK